MKLIGLAAVIALISSAACGDTNTPTVNANNTVITSDAGNNGSDSGATNNATNNTTSDAGQDAETDTATACTDCLYAPDQTYMVGAPATFDTLSYNDVLGQERRLAIAIYRPTGITESAPLIVLSHGGAIGKTDPLKSMDKWGPTFASAGYIAVAIAHPGRNATSYNALCTEIGFTSTAVMCSIKIDWDRPFDVAVVLDWLEARTAVGQPLEGRIDWTKVGHAGHSAGGGAGEMLAGVSRNFICAQSFGSNQGTVVPCDTADLVSMREDRIKAVLALSPQGPGQSGFMTEGYANVAIPLLMATGANDGNPGEPANRKGVYDALAASASGYDFGRIYLDDPGAKHTLFEAETDACVNGTTLAHCKEMRDWLLSAGVAWFDAHLLGSARATEWLQSGNFQRASGDIGTLELK